MCDYPNREAAMVTIRTDENGEPTVWCDPCLSQLVTALNDGGMPTRASCCGHGTHVVSVALADGRWLVVMTAEDWAAFDSRRGTITDAGAREDLAEVLRPFFILGDGHYDVVAADQALDAVMQSPHLAIVSRRSGDPS